VTAHPQDETLADRLKRGPVSARQAVQITRDVLSALQATHARGSVHGHVTPDNIVLEESRAVLTAGTGQGTAQTDLYAVAVVMYEAITGRRWSIGARPEAADWSGIPRPVRRALRKALAPSPQDRFTDAAAFQRALWAPRPQPLVWPAVVVLAVAVVIVGVIVFCEALGFCTKRSSPLQVYELMVVPFDVERGAPPRAGSDLAWIVSDKLALFPQIALVPRSVAFQQGESARVQAAARVGGSVVVRNDTLRVRLEVRDPSDRRLYSAVIARPSGSAVALADSIVVQILRWFHPELAAKYRPRPAWSLNATALAQFLEGEDAFRRNAWSEAARHFCDAWQLDSSFARAAWGLANAQRWRRMPAGVDLRDVLRRHGRLLNPLDSLLIAAELAAHGEPRYRIYQQALALYPRAPYARLLYGAELMHRGPLAGIPLDSGAAVLEEAVAQDPYLAPAHDLLVWALIRLGRRDAARRALDRLTQLRGPDGLSVAPSLEVAFAARFTPKTLPAIPPVVDRDVARMVRFGLGFDVPDLQLTLARRLSGAAGHEAQGLALIALGRPAEAATHLDLAAGLFGTPARQLEALEWRVLPAALGVPGTPPAEADRGRRGLAAAARGRGPIAARAAWASAVDAYARGDTSSARRWRSRLRGLAAGDAARERLDVLLAGLELAARGNVEAALARTAPLLPFEEWQDLGDPFARAVLHVRRAGWLEAQSRPDSADRSWLWYENADFAGWLSDTLQAVEVDWSLSAWSRWRRGMLARRGRAGEAAGCPYLTRAAQLWAHAEPPYEPLVAEARCPR
jgi:tetratricopeptide (TPR) repeat protein